MTLTLDEWTKYRDLLKKLSDTAADEFRDAIWAKSGYFGGVGLGNIPRNEVIGYAYALINKYGEASTALACEMYDAMAALSGEFLDPAEPASIASINEIGKAINGVIKTTENEEKISSVVGRFVKQAGQDTTLKNAKRDGAQFAWIPNGDTCAFCITLASRGWQYSTKASYKDGHAEHIHANCDCAYAVRFNNKTNVQGYNPEAYRKQYENAEGSNTEEKINSMRRKYYAENKAEILDQKASAYEKRQELNNSQAEETKIN